MIPTQKLVYIALLGGFRDQNWIIYRIFTIPGACSSQPGGEIKSPPLHFYSIFKLDQHQPSMIFSYRPLKKNLGAPGPDPADENADIGHLSPISNLPCMPPVLLLYSYRTSSLVPESKGKICRI